MSDSDYALIADVSNYLDTDCLLCIHCRGKKPLYAFLESLKELWDGDRLSRTPRSCDLNNITAKIARRKKDISNCQTRKLQFIVDGKDVSGIDARLAVLRTILEEAYSSRSVIKRTAETYRPRRSALPAVVPAVVPAAVSSDDPFGIYISPPPASTNPLNIMDDTFSIFSLAQY
jgi:hypothetical protein